MARITRAKMNEEEEEEEEKEVEEAMRLKSLAEEHYKRSKLKSALRYAKRANRLCPNLEGISDMVTTFKILHVYFKSSSSSSTTGPDWYSILQVEPFSHINSIKKQYKKLALILHPDKNTCIASEEAFKRISEANQVLSDKIRRKEYDLKLRIALQSQATATFTHAPPATMDDTFWTSCSRCRLLHQFDRRYIGHCLICPTCKRGFVAEEVSVENENENDNDFDNDSVHQVEFRGKGVGVRTKSSPWVEQQPVKRSSRVPVKRKFFDIIDDVSCSTENPRFNLRPRLKKVEKKPEMTLAQMQLEAKKKTQAKKAAEEAKVKEREAKNKNGKMAVRDCAKETKQSGKEKEKKKKTRAVANIEENSNLDIMVVEDSDFHDFDKDRTERCFKKTQIWAIYDDDDGMPRHYGLIDEVESVNPFVVKMSWLDMESNGDERLICWEKSGFHISCGRFKVSRKIVIDSVNVFSHLVYCERIAREIYWICPKKGSIWALYSEKGLKGEKRNQMSAETRFYDIVLSLTTYSDIHGLSVAYLEKVEGFKTVFRRREIGVHAIRWIEKDDFQLFSHQIPAKKLSDNEVSYLPRECWELDPASLPQDMLSLEWER